MWYFLSVSQYVSLYSITCDVGNYSLHESFPNFLIAFAQTILETIEGVEPTTPSGCPCVVVK